MEYKKILIIRTGAIGDVVHTTGLIHAVKKAYPEVLIHYLTNPMLKFMLENDPAIEKVHTIESKFKLFSSYTIQMAKILKQEHYDLVINLQPSFKLRMLTFLSGIKKKAIYKKDFKMHAVTNFWVTARKDFPNIKEEKEVKIYLSEEAINKAKEKMKDFRRPLIVINAGGMFSKRQGRTYPRNKWIDLGNKIQDKYNGTVILNGAEEDAEFLLPLGQIQNSVNYIGWFPLEDSCAIISQADLMISGDSGPLHIATALGVKSIGLYGSMPVNRTGCYCNGINIQSPKSCVPCNHRKCKLIKGTDKIYTPCMEEINPNTILNNIDLM